MTRKKAVACQKALADAGTRAAKLRTDALALCTKEAFACVLDPEADAQCLPKAAQKCSTGLGKSSDATAKLVTGLAANASCGALAPTDLFRAEGLGLGPLVSACQQSFGLDVCSSFANIAECVVRSSARAAADAYGHGSPRTREMLSALAALPLPHPLPTVDGLPIYAVDAGCAAPPCAVAVAERDRVAACGQLVRKAFTELDAKYARR